MINLPVQPSFRDSFLFPLKTPAARRDLFIGGTLLVTLLPGWILNLGHRLELVHRLAANDRPAFRGFSPWGFTFVRGLQAFLAISVYLSPCLIMGAIAWVLWSSKLFVGAAGFGSVSFFLFVGGVYVLPGGMTRNAAYRDMSYLYRPDRAYQIARQGGLRYLKAWLIALTSIVLSFLGLLAAGIGFLYTSVWAWMVVGYAFSVALLDVGEAYLDHALQPATPIADSGD